MNLLALIAGVSLLGGLTDSTSAKPADAAPAAEVGVAEPVKAAKPAEGNAREAKPAETAERPPAAVTVARPGTAPKKARKAAKGDGKKGVKLPLGGKGGKAAEGPRTVRITSQRTDYDRKEGVIMFDREVFVDDPEYKMHADQVYVFLDGTNDLRRIVALGNVSITNELRSGFCAKATYTKALSRIVMYGDGTNVVAWLKDAGKNKSEVRGRRITFWIDSEQVEIEGSEMLLDAGNVGGKNGARKILGK